MAIHYFSDIKHVTCATRMGQRRSPVSDIAYNSGQELVDLTTGRVHARPHTDGTTIIATDIVCASPCPYGDSLVPSSLRRERMYNDLYCLNKKNTERIYWKAIIALPNEIGKEQLKSLAETIALVFSAKLQRPVDYSVHLKSGNNHMHIAVPERKHDKRWGPKSRSFYVNKDGTINYQKQYKDVDGNDIRKPRTVDDKEPVYAQDDTGHKVCINQFRDANGRRKWKMVNVEGLKPDEVAWMHDEADRVQNLFLQEWGIAAIQRNDPRTRKDLKDMGISAEHIGKRDAKLKNKSYYDKVKQNIQYKTISNLLNNQYKQIDTAEQRLKDAVVAEVKGEKTLRNILDKCKTTNMELRRLKEGIIFQGTDFIRSALHDIYSGAHETLVQTTERLAAIGQAIADSRQKTACQDKLAINSSKTTELKTQTATDSHLSEHSSVQDPMPPEYKNASDVRVEKLLAYRNAAIDIYTDNMYAKRLSAWQTYVAAKEPVDKMYDRLQRTVELEGTDSPDNDIVAVCMEKYDSEKKKLSALYPIPPTEPNRDAIHKEGIKVFGKLRADLIENRLKHMKLPVPEFELMDYKQADKVVQDYWKRLHPEGNATGLRIEKTKQKNTLSNDYAFIKS